MVQANNATFDIIVALFAPSRHDYVIRRIMLQKSPRPEGLTPRLKSEKTNEK